MADSQHNGTTTSAGRIRVALLTVQLLFGFHYLAAKLVLAEMSPAGWVCVRVWASFVVLVLIGVAWSAFGAGGRSRLPPRGDIIKLAWLSLFGITINQTLFLEGLARTTPAHASLICTQIPLFATLTAMFMGQERLSVSKGLALFAGMAGVLILLRVDQFRLDNEYLVGDLLNVGNAISYGVFIPLSRKVMQRNDPLAATTVLFFFGAIGVSLYGIREMLQVDFGALSPVALSGALYTILGATVATYFLNLWALKRTGASRVALYIFLQPVIAVLAGVIVLGDAITVRFLVALVLVFVALVLREWGGDGK